MTTHLREATRPVPAERPLYSIVAPVFNEEETLPHFYERITAVIEGLGEPYTCKPVDSSIFFTR